MKLYPPMIIGARLLPAVEFETFTVSLDPETWEYFIDFHGEAEGTEEIEGNDFKPGLLPQDEDEAVREMMKSLLSFIDAYAEACHWQEWSKRESENADLFPARFEPWARYDSDNVTLAWLELEEG